MYKNILVCTVLPTEWKMGHTIVIRTLKKIISCIHSQNFDELYPFIIFQTYSFYSLEEYFNLKFDLNFNSQL